MNLLNLQSIAKEITTDVINLLTEDGYTEDNEYRAKALVSGLATIVVKSPVSCEMYKGKFALSWIDSEQDFVDNIEDLKVIFGDTTISSERYTDHHSHCVLSIL